ncbi:hypothetical protein O0L34_g747 [Tuta absoluta]|nr:hypothetical protein O0L34_g747 [Tuta absoluta]
MWLPTEICLLLACIITIQAVDTNSTEQERPKRDLQFLKDVLAAKLGLTPPKPILKEEIVKIVRVPAFDQVLVKPVPSATFVEPMPARIVQVDPTMALIGSYLGTKSAEETIFAMQNMKQLVQSGLLKTRQEVIEVVPPRPPVYVLQPPIVQQKMPCPEPRPVYPIFERTVVPMPQPPITVLPPPPPPPPAPIPMPVLPPLPVLPPPAKLIPVPAKVVVPEIRPMPLPVSLPPPMVPFFPTTYSYKQGYPDGGVTTYYSEGNQDVIVTETHEPPPPLPGFIVERLENIVGKPMGSHIHAGEFFAPIVTEPSNVDVKFNPYKPISVPEEQGYKYKHVHADGSISTYAGAEFTKQPFTELYYDSVSKLPSPPPAILDRIQIASESAYKPRPWGYSLQTADGVSTYKTIDGDKIYYSRLESPQSNPDSVFPAALSYPTDDHSSSPHSNVIVIENDKNNDDKIYNMNIAANGDEDKTRTDIEPMKKFPALPTPIVGESYSSAGYSYKLVHSNSPDETKATLSTNTPPEPEPAKKNEYHGFGTNGFSYTQVNHDGTVDTFTGNELESKPALPKETIKEIPALPSPITSDQPKPEPPLVIIDLGQEKHSGFSYTQTNNGGTVTKFSGGEHVIKPESVLEVQDVPVQPAAVIDVIQPVIKPPCKSRKKCKKPASAPVEASGFSYTQIGNEGVTKFTGDGQVQIPVNEVVEVPVPLATIVDVIQPIPNPVQVSPQSVEVEVFPKPVWSNYVYKQISHTNPQPFTVVKVGNGPEIEVPAGEVEVKVNKHEHVRPDGTTYPCMEVHKVVPDAPIPPVPTAHMVSTIPEGFMFVPPENENGENPPSNTQKIEMHSAGSHFSYTQVSSGSTSESPAKTSETSSSDAPLPLHLNPIVVAPVDSSYSYTQKHSDGSSLSVRGDKDNTVLVKIEGELKTSDAGRGDIPEARE